MTGLVSNDMDNCGQLSLVIPPWISTTSTSESWEANKLTTQSTTSPIGNNNNNNNNRICIARVCRMTSEVL